MTGVYRVKNEQIAVLHKIASDLVKQIGTVHFKHVYREQNSMADALCNEALDDPTLPNEALGLLHAKPAPAPAKKPASCASMNVRPPATTRLNSHKSAPRSMTPASPSKALAILHH